MDDNGLEAGTAFLNLQDQWQPALLSDDDTDELDDLILDGIPDNLNWDMSPTLDNLMDSIDKIRYSPVDESELDIYTENCQTASDNLTVNSQMPVMSLLNPPHLSQENPSIESLSLNDHDLSHGVSDSIKTGSMPLEPTVINDSIVVSGQIAQREKSRRRSTKQLSSKIAPIHCTQGGKSTRKMHHADILLSTLDVCVIDPAIGLENVQHNLQQTDSSDEEKIKILSPPRLKFRPRTQNECQQASHFLRCAEGAQHEYPTVATKPTWALTAKHNFYEVTLVGIDNQPHPYIISNKSCSDHYDEDALIFRNGEQHTMYFRITNDDFAKGMKCFHIEFIKKKQDQVITKELIKTRQLNHSKLRFTRLHIDMNGYSHRDEASTEYSPLMSEAYADVSVEHFGPRYGPMSGDMVYIRFKGRILTEEITITVSENNRIHNQLSLTKMINIIMLKMPTITDTCHVRSIANIVIYYKGELIYQTNYLYNLSLDEALADLSLHDQPSLAISNVPQMPDFHASNVFPALKLSKRCSTSKQVKRLGVKRENTGAS